MNLALFGLGNSHPFTSQIAGVLGVKPGELREEWRPDTEPWAAAVSNVRGRDVFVVSSLYADAGLSSSDLTMQMLLFIDALKRASAGRVTAVTPYLSFMRQDRKEGSREPVSTQAVAKFFEAAGADRVLMMDAHNISSQQCSFRIPVDILEANNLLADAVAAADPGPLTVLSPDQGGVKRAEKFHVSVERRLGRQVEMAYAYKSRKGPYSVSVHRIVGPVEGRNVVVVDDMIATGGTIKKLGEAVRGAGGKLWGVAATHGLFSGQCIADNLRGVENIWVADTVSRYGANYVVRTAPLFAEAIRRIHSGEGSLSELLCDS